MNDGSFARNFFVTKNKLSTTPLNFKKEIKKVDSIIRVPKIRDEIEIKDRSPLIYNRHKIAILDSKKYMTSNKKLDERENQLIDKIKIESVEKVDVRLLEKERENNKKLENEMKLLVWKMNQQEKIIKDQSQRIKELEEKNIYILNESNKIKEKYEILENRLNNLQNQSEEEEYYPQDEMINTDRLSRIAEILGSMRGFIYNAQESENEINEMYPNPDNMTYEQLLELQEKIGFVNKGFSADEIKQIPTIIFNKSNDNRRNYSETCTICQFDYVEKEFLKELNCHHCYHEPCIEEWLKNNKACPICKEEVKF